MTTLAGIQGNGWSVIGSDTRVIDDSRIYSTPRHSSKIFKVSDYIIAVAGDWRPAQILQHDMVYPKLPVKPTEKTMEKFFSQEFIPSLRNTYADEGWAIDKDTESSLLISACGYMFSVDTDYAWTRDRRGYYGVGTGGDYAVGYMSAFSFPKDVETAKDIVRRALGVASQYDSNTGEPFIIYTQENK